MPSASRVIIAAAGGGKTTRIVREAIEESTRKVALVTYTLNNVKVMQDKLYLLAGAPPPHVEVFSWFSFLLRDLARPYRNALYDKRIEGLLFVEGRSSVYAKSSNIEKHYFATGKLIYSDKIARFACECDKTTNGAVMRRLKQRFDHIYIDEVQDLAGYDLELVQRMLEAGIQLTLVGDTGRPLSPRTTPRRILDTFGPTSSSSSKSGAKQGFLSLPTKQTATDANNRS